MIRLAEARRAASTMIEMLHNGVVDGGVAVGGVALDDEHVGAPHRLLEPAVDLAVGEVGDVGLHQLLAKHLGDLGGQVRDWPAPRG